jgi:hypothetical protein
MFNKYFVVSLSLMLILSNFSYASQLMFCEMTGGTTECECRHTEHKKFDGVSLSQEKSQCCNEETTELSNTNTLLNVNQGTDQDFPVYPVFINIPFGLSGNISDLIIYFHGISQLPKNDIPIFTSSLLI